MPQPFLTEAIASRVSADVGGNPIDAIALGVELFNPQDFSYDPNNPQLDVFALNLNQYRVRLASGVMNAPWDSDPLSTLPVRGTTQRPDADRMNGRTFLAFALEESSDNRVFRRGGVTPFNKGMDATGMTGRPDFDAAAEKIRVQLQRLGKDGVWRTVDQMLLDVPGSNNYTFEVRDTSPTRLFGPPDFNLDFQPDDVNGDDVPEPFARWNVVMSLEPDDGTGEPTASTLGNASYVTDSAGVPFFNPDASLLNVPKAPMTPLITMNAAPRNDLMMFGNPDDLRPRSFPTVGFLLFVPRFSHYATASQAITLSETLARQWENQMGSGHAAYKVVPDPTKSSGQTIVADYPIDFGHMPVFDNSTPVRKGSYLSKVSGERPSSAANDGIARGVGLPWGLLVFDYFTTLNPHAEDVDPYRVPGLIDINAASWNVLAELPLMGPFAPYNQVAPAIGERQQLPLRWYASSPSIIRPAPSLADPSPSFWDPFVGVLTGMAAEQVDAAEGPNFDRRARLLHGSVPGVTTGGRMLPEYDTLNTLDNGQYRLGGWLSQAVASYRDGIRYIANSMSGSRYRLSYLRGGFGVAPNPGQNVRPPYRNGDLYAPKLPGWPSPMNIAANVPGGGVRGADRGDPDDGRPEDFGFITLGELLNVQGFDSTLPQDIDNSATPYPYSTPLIEFQLRNTTLSRGDFVKAVSLMALLDTQVLTTRSNTFTVYASVIDREDPSASIRTQVTIDRSNLLPRLQYTSGSNQQPIVPKLVRSVNGGAMIPIQTFNDDAQPTVIARRRAAYFNSRYDN
ncbi:MAG: hypothetical protein D6744_01170 [Planctomycetota bacterium]|nr:MAG: hypothetical protein D6744_01170 [Planctomycetota bacterium]